MLSGKKILKKLFWLLSQALEFFSIYFLSEIFRFSSYCSHKYLVYDQFKTYFKHRLIQRAFGTCQLAWDSYVLSRIKGYVRYFCQVLHLSDGNMSKSNKYQLQPLLSCSSSITINFSSALATTLEAKSLHKFSNKHVA